MPNTSISEKLSRVEIFRGTCFRRRYHFIYIFFFSSKFLPPLRFKYEGYVTVNKKCIVSNLRTKLPPLSTTFPFHLAPMFSCSWISNAHDDQLRRENKKLILRDKYCIRSVVARGLVEAANIFTPARAR